MSGIRSLPMIKLLTGLLLLARPFVIWFGLAHNGLHWLLPLMALLLLLRLRQTRRRGRAFTSRHATRRCRGHRIMCRQLYVENAPATAVLPGSG